MKTARYGVALTDKEKIGFPALPAMADLLTEIAHSRGISRSELLRRLTADLIAEQAPKRLAKLPAADKQRIALLATLHSA